MPILETRSEVKVKVTQGWSATPCHLKMHAHTKFGIPTSTNIGDMHRTSGGTDGQCDYYMPPKVPLGHKKFSNLGAWFQRFRVNERTVLTL